MLTKDFSLKIQSKSLDESTGGFVGLAAVYNDLDFASDRILPGAFNQAIAQQSSSGYPLLWSHRTDEPIGTARIADSKEGLICTGKILLSDLHGARAYNLIKNNVVRGLSFGFSLPSESSGKTVYNSDRSRSLREIVVHEISIVSIPCQPAAQILSVKALSQVEPLLRRLSPADMTAADLEQLRSINLTLKSILRKDTTCGCDCPECVSGNCIGCSDPDRNCEVSAKAQAVEKLEMLKSFAAELKAIV